MLHFAKGSSPKINCVDTLIQTVLDVRHQGRALCHYLAPSQLPSLLYTMVLCTLCVLSGLLILSGVSWGDDEDRKIVTINFICVVFLSLRVYVKSSVGQQVTDEVSVRVVTAVSFRVSFNFKIDYAGREIVADALDTRLGKFTKRQRKGE